MTTMGRAVDFAKLDQATKLNLTYKDSLILQERTSPYPQAG